MNWKSIVPWYTKNYQFSNVSIQTQVPLKETIWKWCLYKEMYGMETIWSKDCWKYQDLYLAIKKKNRVGKITKHLAYLRVKSKQFADSHPLKKTQM